AGCARSAWVYLSTDGGASWAQNSKPPTGQSDTCLIIAPDFTNQHKVYVVTRGTESAFSYSADGGRTWNQISLIETKISDITDIATPSATTIFMLTFNNTNLKQSLWRTADGGATWDRVLCSSVSGFDSLNLIRPVPQYSADSPLIIIAGQANGNPVIWTSADNGQNITGRTAPCNIDTLAIVDSSTWFVSGYDGSKDQVYQTADGGNTYTLPTEAGVQPLAAITLSPSYGQDKTILAGNIVGQVFISQDNGANFSLVGSALPLVSGAGRVSVAFDCSFGQNRIIYAATDAKVSAAGKDRIFRFALGQSTAWKSITSSLPDAAVIKQVVIGDDGTLYALNAEPLSAADTKGGVLRALNPTSSAPTFETMLAGFEDGVTLNKMSFCGNQLYVVDTKNMRLAKFVDTLTSPPALVSPEDKATGLDTTGLNLKFEAVDGAGGYEWQVSDNASFSGLLTGLTGTSDSSSASVSGLTPAATYYWRVRVNSPYLSRWSDTWLFYTMLGGTNVVPLLSVPQAGAITGVKPVFQWSTINAATKYDLLVAADTDFTDIVIDKTGDNAVNSNAWESDIVLKNTTTYYWKVKARSDKSYGGWSAVSAFTTVPATVTTTTAAVTSTTDPTPTTATTASTAVIATPAETTLISTSTLIVQLPGTTQPVNVNVSIPHWIIYGGIGLSAIIVVTLAVLVVATIRRRH
ncbi:MAG: hypothetical protein WBQ62_07255, partial [Dehalococcoidales bacterium]